MDQTILEFQLQKLREQNDRIEKMMEKLVAALCSKPEPYWANQDWMSKQGTNGLPTVRED